MKVDELYKIEEYSEFIKFCSEYEIRDVEDLKPSDFVLFQKLSKCGDSFKFRLMDLWKNRDVIEITRTQENTSTEKASGWANHSEGIVEEAIKLKRYPNEMGKFINTVKKTTSKILKTDEEIRDFIENGGWKLRKSGREILNGVDHCFEEDNGISLKITVGSAT